eukprot:5530543-Ditylum_brightwellii.AAC.1
MAKCSCLSIRCKLLDIVHNAQSATAHMGNRKSCICSLELSWIVVRTYVKGGATRGVTLVRCLISRCWGKTEL